MYNELMELFKDDMDKKFAEGEAERQRLEVERSRLEERIKKLEAELKRAKVAML